MASVALNKNYLKLSDEDSRREKRIVGQLNLKKLPYKISSDKLCNLTVAMARHSKEVLKYQDDLRLMNLEKKYIKKKYLENYQNIPTKQLHKLLMKE